MRDLMNRGRKRRPTSLPDLTGAAVELVEIKPNKRNQSRWTVTVNINGWPYDIEVWGQDELAVMTQVLEWKNGAKTFRMFDNSK